MCKHGSARVFERANRFPNGKVDFNAMNVKKKPARKPGQPAGKTARRGPSAVPDGSHRAAPDPDAPEDIRDAVSRLKRERIIATAVQLFYDKGFNNTTLEAVAEAMNVTKPFIYSHFRSKSELLAEICSRGIRSSLEALQNAVALQGSPSEKLESMARGFMLAVLANQAHIAIYNREEKHLAPADREAINNLRREFDRGFTALLEAGVISGEFQVDDVHLASLAIGGIVSWSYVWFRPSGRLSQAETAERIAALVLQMVGAKTARRKRSSLAAVTSTR
jgi:TetR/AcrR family transcriptional regulator, cholesterol catabolism regulator